MAQRCQNNFETQVGSKQKQICVQKKEKVFKHSNFNVSYSNNSSVASINNDGTKEVQIINSICEKRGNMLYKLTEILYEGKLIRIEDTFSIEDKHLQNEDVKQKEKMPQRTNMLKKSLWNKSNEGEKKQKQDKKNVVKNLIKLFMCWLEKRRQENYGIYEDEMKRLLKEYKYNNRLIKEMFYNQIVCKVFFTFLKDYVDEEIQRSHIHDKETHHEAAQIYRTIMIKNKQIHIIEHFEEQIDYLL